MMHATPFPRILAKSDSDLVRWRVSSKIFALVGCASTDRTSSVVAGKNGFMVPNYGPHKRIIDVAQLGRSANCVLATWTNAI